MTNIGALTNEDGTYKENPDSKHIEADTKIYINSISEDGYSLKFKTEDWRHCIFEVKLSTLQKEYTQVRDIDN